MRREGGEGCDLTVYRSPCQWEDSGQMRPLLLEPSPEWGDWLTLETPQAAAKRAQPLGSGGPLTWLLALHHFITSGSVMLDRSLPLSEPQVPTRRQP